MTVTPLGAGLYRVTDGSRQWTVAVAGPPENRWVWIEGLTTRLEPPQAAKARRESRAGRDELMSPMPATVVRIAVAVDHRVKRGDTLLVLEAMKMELPIRAPRDGIVAALHCEPGQLVQPGVALIDLK